MLSSVCANGATTVSRHAKSRTVGACGRSLKKVLTERMGNRPLADEWVVLDEVLATHRPSGFFMSEAYAKKLVYKMLKQPIKTDL